MWYVLPVHSIQSRDEQELFSLNIHTDGIADRIWWTSIQCNLIHIAYAHFAAIYVNI